MAKLNGITVLGEVIAKDGVQYAASTEKAETGDVIKALTGIADVCVGDYFIVKSSSRRVYFTDNVGDDRIHLDIDDRVRLGQFALYKPVKTPITSAPSFTEVKRKAAVGERIKIVNRSFSESRYSNGDEFTVNRVDYDGDVYVTTVNSGEAMVCLFEYVVLEPVKTTPITPRPYQPGDVVRGKASGSLYTLLERKPGFDTFGNGLAWKTSGSWIGESQFTLVTPVAEKPINKCLPIGSFGKIVGDGSRRGSFGRHQFNIGDVVEIVEHSSIYGDRVGAKIVGERGDNAAWYVHNDDIVATEKPAPEKPKAPAIKVGDHVKLTIADGKTPEYGYGMNGVKNGDIGVVRRYDLDGDLRVDFPKQRDWVGLVSEFTLVTESDVAAAAESAKWSAIGRKVGEIVTAESTGIFTVKSNQFNDGRGRDDTQWISDSDIYRVLVPITPTEPIQPKHAAVGDKIRITRNQFGAPVGTVVTVTEIHHPEIGKGVNYHYSGHKYGASHDAYEIVSGSAEPEKPVDAPHVFQVGDKAVVASKSGGIFPFSINVGDVVTIITNEWGPDDCDYHVRVGNGDHAYASKNGGLAPYVEPKPARLTVGEYAVVNDGADGNIHKYIGKVTKIAGDDGSSSPFLVSTINGDLIGYAYEREVRRATPAEIIAASISTPSAPATVWTRLGRAEDEYKNGDIVKVTVATSSRNAVGTIGVVGNVGETSSYAGFTVTAFNESALSRSSTGNWHLARSVELIAPVESRLDTE